MPAAGQDDHQRRRPRARATTPRIAPASPSDAGLDDDRAPDLAAGHPGGAQDADLADAFDDVHGQRVDDPERGDEDGDDGERIEQAEDPAERVADGALDLVER